MTRPARRSTALVAVLGATAALAACAPSNGGSDSGGGDGGTTLTVWSWRVEDEAAYTKIFDAYEKAHPGVTVNFKAFKATEYNKILATGLAGSDGPDVPQVRSYGQLQTTVASGSLVPLDGKVDLATYARDMAEAGAAPARIAEVETALANLPGARRVATAAVEGDLPPPAEPGGGKKRSVRL